MESLAAGAREGVPVVLRDAGKVFLAHRFVLRHIDLTFAPGERVALFGHNGAGKSTLIRMIAGLLRPTEGGVTVGGVAPWDAGKGAAARAHIGLLSHQTYLYDDLTPLENLVLYGQLYGLTDARGRAAGLLEAVGLTGAANRPVRTLSRGMQQRAALARATLHDPSVLLLDEPETGLDAAARRKLEEVATQDAPGRTMVLATHNLELGMSVTDRWIILDGGRVAHDTTSKETDGAEFRELYSRIVERSQVAAH